LFSISSFLRIILFPFFFLLLILSCKENPTTPSEPPKPPGYQEDIPWPSLADSPWPMSLQNPQSTGRSKLYGPSQGIVECKIDSLINLSCGVVQGSDSTIYIAVPLPQAMLYAYNQDGSEKWSFELGSPIEINTTPVISADSLIYVSGGINSTNKIYTIKLNGRLNWSYEISSFTNINQSSLVLDKDGNLFFADFNRNIYCLNKNGMLVWKKNIVELNPSSFSQFSFSPDSKTIYAQGLNISVIALEALTGNVIWTYGKTPIHVSPIIDNDGNIYFVSEPVSTSKCQFICLNREGNEKWIHYFNYKNKSPAYNQPCLDRFGNFYFGSDTVYSINYAGNLNWKYVLNNSSIHTPILCDNDNNIYFGVGLDNDKAGFISLTYKGNLRWFLIFNEEPLILGGSPAIGFGGKIYCPTWIVGNKIFTIK
jgi:outer membrane protein assembly factor BamB